MFLGRFAKLSVAEIAPAAWIRGGRVTGSIGPPDEGAATYGWLIPMATMLGPVKWGKSVLEAPI